jgi:hypothetical protein
MEQKGGMVRLLTLRIDAIMFLGITPMPVFGVRSGEDRGEGQSIQLSITDPRRGSRSDA